MEGHEGSFRVKIAEKRMGQCAIFREALTVYIGYEINRRVAS